MLVKTLGAYLENVGIKVGDFADKLDCTRQYMGLIISGRRLPGKQLARRILHETDGVINFLPAIEEKKKLKK